MQMRKGGGRKHKLNRRRKQIETRRERWQQEGCEMDCTGNTRRTTGLEMRGSEREQGWRVVLRRGELRR